MDGREPRRAGEGRSFETHGSGEMRTSPTVAITGTAILRRVSSQNEVSDESWNRSS